MPIDFEVTKKYKPEPATEHELECAEKLEVGDYEIYSRKMELICLEGRETMCKMGVSPAIEAGDVCVGIYTARGDLATAILGTHLHLVNGQIAIKYVLKHFKEDPTIGIRPGDMFYVNEAAFGGMHNPDQILFMPVFYQDELIAWTASMGHEADTGAIEPGGVPPSATSRYDEGLHLPPFKVGENHQLRTDLLELMAFHVRDSRMQMLDVKARLTACQLVERRVQEIIGKKGVDFLIGIMRRIIDESAEAARKKILELNDGTYRQSVFLSSVGAGKAGLLRAMVAVHKKGDRVTVDFTGTSPRVKRANFNSFPHCMVAMTACYLFQFLFWELKPSCGIFAPFNYVFPKGCFLDADFEDAVSAGVPTVANSLTAVHICFEKMLFDSEFRDSIQAPWGTSGTPVFGGLNQYNRPYATYEMAILNGVGQGAKINADGTDAGGFVYCPVGDFGEAEHFEMQFPLVGLFRNKYFKDGHGFGKYRGGRPIAFAHFVHQAKSPVAQPTIAGVTTFPINVGLFGGYAPPPSPSIRIKKTNLKEIIEKYPEDIPYDLEDMLKGKIKGDLDVDQYFSGARFLEEGDIALYAGYGGPGYGDVLERSPDLVIKDLKEESISHWVAQNVYKVAYDPETLEVDYDRTEELRDKERDERKRRGKPYEDFEKEWLRKKPKEEMLRYFGPWPYPEKVPELIKM